MKRMTVRYLTLAVVCAAAVVSGGCDAATQLASPDAPQFSSHRPGAFTKVTTSGEVTGSDERTLTAAGGELNVTNSLGHHQLRVTAGTVTQPVTFWMTFRGTGYDIELGARDARTGSVNVGERGFRRAILLCLDVSRLAGVDASRLVIAQELGSGVLDPVPSSIDPRTGQLCGELRHFSNYTVASD